MGLGLGPADWAPNPHLTAFLKLSDILHERERGNENASVFHFFIIYIQFFRFVLEFDI